jgi:hypothetical protein
MVLIPNVSVSRVAVVSRTLHLTSCTYQKTIPGDLPQTTIDSSLPRNIPGIG